MIIWRIARPSKIVMIFSIPLITENIALILDDLMTIRILHAKIVEIISDVIKISFPHDFRRIIRDRDPLDRRHGRAALRSAGITRRDIFF